MELALAVRLVRRIRQQILLAQRARDQIVDLVEILFLSLPSAEVAIDRVAMRVRQGGHDIPESVIRRRFQTGLRNFKEVYRSLVDRWSLYDNSGPVPVKVDGGQNV